ncbi:MAG: PilZ domain-containing protein [Candidatus Omnitrophica bacterium]|nr:PilZ domain-containing protein [Candidatus Omnitrophota bacterium]MDD5437329.1 PilZ domain-containing protein [Candidatus Omnitrophota bacterium]
MQERRRYIRIPEKTRISYRCIPRSRVSGYVTKDVGAGGIRFLVQRFIPKGTFLRIKLDLSGPTTAIEAVVKLVRITGIAHSDEYEVGVQFVDIPSHAAKHLVNYIEDFISGK